MNPYLKSPRNELRLGWLEIEKKIGGMRVRKSYQKEMAEKTPAVATV
jgi:hypothetical protein